MQRIVSTLVLALVLVSRFAAAAEQRAAVFETELERPVRFRYLVFVPEAEQGKKLPLIVFLHGAGERGDDLERVKRHGPPKIVERKKDFPFIVVSPQCPARSWWEPRSLAAFVEHVIETYPVDDDRVYLTGLSMGGFGTWSLAALRPELFAAIAPICGGGDPKTADRLRRMPVWVFHGARDNVVPVARSQAMVDALKKAGNEDVRFTIYPDAGHDSWTATYDDPELYKWFLSHRRSERDRIEVGLPRARPEAVGLSRFKLAEIDRAVERFVADREIAGAVVGVARKGRVAYARAFGFRDLEAEAPMTLDTIFRIYSMTKPITSVAVMTLVEEGKIALDAPVHEYIPEFRGLRVYRGGTGDSMELVAPERPMTVRDLLRHTSGLTYGIFGSSEVDRLYREAGVLAPQSALADMVRKLAKIPLLEHPGKQWIYSVSTDVLGYLVEKVSGKRLDDFFRERIFEPLDMRETAFFVPEESPGRFAVNYSRAQEGGLRAIDRPETSSYRSEPTFLSGGGGLVSTLRDYLRFTQMLLNLGELEGKRILKPETVREMTRDQLPREAFPIGFGPVRRRGVGFGLGFSVRVEVDPAQPSSPPGEYGWGGAASTHFWISPAHELAVVALSQYMPYSSRLEDAIKPIVYEAVERYAALPRRPADRPRAHSLPPAGLRGVAGLEPALARAFAGRKGGGAFSPLPAAPGR